jgi:hypothetical protein
MNKEMCNICKNVHNLIHNYTNENVFECERFIKTLDQCVVTEMQKYKEWSEGLIIKYRRGKYAVSCCKCHSVKEYELWWFNPMCSYEFRPPFKLQ